MSFLTRSFRLPLLVATLFTAVSQIAVADDISPQDLVRDTSSRMLVALHDEQESINEDSVSIKNIGEDLQSRKELRKDDVV